MQITEAVWGWQWAEKWTRWHSSSPVLLPPSADKNRLGTIRRQLFRLEPVPIHTCWLLCIIGRLTNL